MTWIVGILAVLLAVVLHDILQKKHAIIRNFPIIGHFRYWLEAVGPELRQYIVTNNDEERPFSRDQRRWIYSSAKRENSNFGFGTDNDLDSPTNYVIIKQAAFPTEVPEGGDPADYPLPCSKELGGLQEAPPALRARVDSKSQRHELRVAGLAGRDGSESGGQARRLPP